MSRLRPSSRSIARTVTRAACDGGTVITISDDEIDRALEHEIWDLDFPALRPVFAERRLADHINVAGTACATAGKVSGAESE